MSMTEIKHALRALEFPQSAREALVRIEQVLVGRTAPSSKQLDIAMDVISEFVFCESDRRGSRRGGGLNPLQELQLIDVICDYLSSCTNETTKNTVFLSLFGGVESQRRLKVLSILASMAVSASSTSVLLSVGVWLQQMGCSSALSLQLVENIIKDHFFLNTSNQTTLKTLAITAPQFVSNFITAVTELYINDIIVVKKMPPKNLLEVVTSWVYSNPSLCMSAQLNPPPLPPGAIPMAAVTPLAGLIRWCVLAPLCIDDDTEMVEVVVPMKKIKIEGVNEPVKSALPSKTLTEAELYIKLQLGVLHALRAGRRSGGPPTAVSASTLQALLPALHAHKSRLVQARVDPAKDDKLQDCLDRFGQAIQVALANSCIYGHVNNLITALEALPKNRLLWIIIRKHQQTM